jgi:hypothetical protein
MVNEHLRNIYVSVLKKGWRIDSVSKILDAWLDYPSRDWTENGYYVVLKRDGHYLDNIMEEWLLPQKESR